MSLNVSVVFFPNTNEPNNTIEQMEEQLIPDDVMDALNFYFDFILRSVITLFGVFANITNMIIFFRLGLKDSMTVGLMALSFTDFLVTILGVGGTAGFAWDIMFPSVSFDPVTFQFIAFGWQRDTCYLISGWITTLLSVERCVCVVSPFRVKQIFTRMRMIIAITIVYMVTIAVHMPVFLSQRLDWETIPVIKNNKTIFVKDKMTVRFWDNRDKIQVFIDIANGAVLPIPSQAIVLISVVWMIYGLHASSQVRKSASDENTDSKKTKSNLSSRESRLVKVVLFLAIILTLSNIPRFLAIYAKQIFSEVFIDGKDVNLYSLLWNVTAVAGITNSSINIFVYLIVNSNYRQEFKKLFHFIPSRKMKEGS